jgi:hypothetical protein
VELPDADEIGPGSSPLPCRSKRLIALGRRKSEPPVSPRAAEHPVLSAQSRPKRRHPRPCSRRRAGRVASSGHRDRTPQQAYALPNCALPRIKAPALRSATTALPALRSVLVGPLARARRCQRAVRPDCLGWLIPGFPIIRRRPEPVESATRRLRRWPAATPDRTRPRVAGCRQLSGMGVASMSRCLM